MENCKPYTMSATGNVGGTQGTVPQKFCGALVTAALGAGGAVLVRNGQGGAIVAALPASSAIGVNQFPTIPVQCDRGVYFDLNGGSGTVTVFIDN